VQRLLLERAESLQPLWSQARLDGLLLEDVLQVGAGADSGLGAQRAVPM
jgi:membrane protein